MTTNLGQGAGMAIEDGVVLAQCLERAATPVEGLRAYEPRRITRTDTMMTLANRLNSSAALEGRLRTDASQRHDLAWLRPRDRSRATRQFIEAEALALEPERNRHVEFEDVLRFINLFCSGVAAGLLIVVMIAVMPTLMSFPPSTVVRFKAKFDPLVDRINPPFVLLVDDHRRRCCCSSATRRAPRWSSRSSASSARSASRPPRWA